MVFKEINIIEEKPFNQETYNKYMAEGVKLFESKSFFKAIQYFEEAKKLDPVNYLPYFYLGNIYLQLGKPLWEKLDLENIDRETIEKLLKAKVFFNKAIVNYISLIQYIEVKNDIKMDTLINVFIYCGYTYHQLGLITKIILRHEPIAIQLLGSEKINKLEYVSYYTQVKKYYTKVMEYFNDLNPDQKNLIFDIYIDYAEVCFELGEISKKIGNDTIAIKNYVEAEKHYSEAKDNFSEAKKAYGEVLKLNQSHASADINLSETNRMIEEIPTQLSSTKIQ
ncbi:MAG: hypothetical protein QM526_01500 [Alphaproteobacteria bacterium]|nr:hypothetical protein [Alphaproteobacteria bacterium]